MDDIPNIKKLYPHIYKKIKILESNQEALNIYIESILIDDRDNGRQGFDLSAFEELIKLGE